MDVFPSTLSKYVSPLGDHPETERRFRLKFKESNVVAINTYLDPKYNKLYYEPIMDWSQLLKNNFAKTGTLSCQFMVSKFDSSRICWENMCNRFKKDLKGKRNTDVRVSFIYDDNKTFLVKRLFTFGQRTVQKGTYHIYQLTDVPLVIYILSDTYKSKVLMRERGFRPEDQFMYGKFILEPGGVYKIPEDVIYVLVSVQKTLFSVHVVDASEFDKNYEDNGMYRDPRETLPADYTKKLLKRGNDKYCDSVQPPMTPALDSMTHSSSNFDKTGLNKIQKKDTLQEFLNPNDLGILPRKRTGSQDDDYDERKKIVKTDEETNYYYTSPVLVENVVEPTCFSNGDPNFYDGNVVTDAVHNSSNGGTCTDVSTHSNFHSSNIIIADAATNSNFHSSNIVTDEFNNSNFYASNVVTDAVHNSNSSNIPDAFNNSNVYSSNVVAVNNSYSISHNIKLADTNFVNWYQNICKKEYPNPATNFKMADSIYPDQVLDLSFKKETPFNFLDCIITPIEDDQAAKKFEELCNSLQMFC